MKTKKYEKYKGNILFDKENCFNLACFTVFFDIRSNSDQLEQSFMNIKIANYALKLEAK